jgi:chitodextrinase
MNKTFSRQWIIGAALVLVASSNGCTMKNQEAPPLTGPSELGTAISVTVAPDVLTQDGGSQSLVTVSAFDKNGKPLRNLSLRSEIMVGGVTADFGTLSARSIVTGSDGRATLVYTAPAAAGGPAVDNRTTVSISVTPLGTDYSNSSSQLATIRLVPPGIVVPPDGLQPYFAMSTSTPKDNENVVFEACNDPAIPCGRSTNPVVSYTWDFGDGRTATGRTTSHTYNIAGTYVVTLRIADTIGSSGIASRAVTVDAGDSPKTSFLFSPTTPKPLDVVNFNAAESKAAAGRTIRSYEWDFGDGTRKTTTTATTTHDFSAAGVYTVTLVVTDDVGRTGFDKRDVTVK